MITIGVVVTTISTGEFLQKYIEAVEQARHACHIVFFVIGDLNTPSECQENCKKIDSLYYRCRYFTFEEQEVFLKKIGFSPELIPSRSDNRRNVGYLLAYESGCDIIISIDDDNFPVDDQFFMHHLLVGQTVSLPVASSADKWFNPMCMLDVYTIDQKKVSAYPRGFPYACRWKDDSKVDVLQTVKGKVGVNVGLWTGDPDIDAITRLTLRCNTEKSQGKFGNSIGLQPEHRMPINTQNTAIIREAVVSYYFLRMNYLISGMRMDRFGDIFSGYFLLKCNHAVGNITAVGPPLTFQDRNAHNLLNDLKIELPGIFIIENFIPFIEESLPTASSYFEAYIQLIFALEKFVHIPENKRFWSPENLLFIVDSVATMKSWHKALLQIS